MFENLSDARQQLLRDKHSLLEGYVAEYLFEMQFLRPQEVKYFSGYTNGWWSAEFGNQRFFFLVSSCLNDIDQRIISSLSPDYEVWRAFPDSMSWHFYKDNLDLDLNSFLDMFHLSRIRPENVATATTRNLIRQNRSIDFLDRHHLLQKVAIERNFADDILTVYFNSIVNIDFFALNPRGKICVLEIKYKFESKSGTFGINVGQFRLFELLANHGMEIEHWILYNKTHNKELSVFGFLDRPGRKWWRRGVIHTDSPGIQKVAPAVTSVQGNKRQEYYEFNESDFQFKAPLKVHI